jgi:hypothetical protein
VLDARIPDGLTQIRASWTLDDLVQAHELLDELDVAEAHARAASGTLEGGRRYG